MTKIFNQPKIRKVTRLMLGGSLVIALAAVAVLVQLKVTKVSAQVNPIIVSTDHLAFGVVFPGELLDRQFTVSLAEGEELADYQVIQQRKPLPVGYEGSGDPDMPGYYRNLCPFLRKVSLEGEGDTEGPDGRASVSLGDLSDLWHVEFMVPAILGQVSQDNTYGFVSAEGDYGCDISIQEAPSTPVAMAFTGGSSGGRGGLPIFGNTASGGPETPTVLGLDTEPWLAIEKRQLTPGAITAGQKDIEFQWVVVNNGNAPVFGIKVLDQLPPGFTMSGSDRTSSNWVIDQLDPGMSRLFNYYVDAGDNITAGTYDNVVTASADNFPDISGSAAIAVDAPLVLGLESGDLTASGFSYFELAAILAMIGILLSAAAMIRKIESQTI